MLAATKFVYSEKWHSLSLLRFGEKWEEMKIYFGTANRFWILQNVLPRHWILNFSGESFFPFSGSRNIHGNERGKEEYLLQWREKNLRFMAQIVKYLSDPNNKSQPNSRINGPINWQIDPRTNFERQRENPSPKRLSSCGVRRHSGGRVRYKPWSYR